MASHRPVYRARFADTLKKGNVFCMNRVGREPMVVTADPAHTANLVGEGKHIHVQVRLPQGTTTGVMVLAVSKVIFIRTEEV